MAIRHVELQLAASYRDIRDVYGARQAVRLKLAATRHAKHACLTNSLSHPDIGLHNVVKCSDHKEF